MCDVVIDLFKCRMKYPVNTGNKGEGNTVELTEAEKKKGYSIARLEMKKRTAAYKPDKPVLKDSSGFIASGFYIGSVEDTLGYAVHLQFTWGRGDGTVGRIYQVTHVFLKVIHKEGQRYLRLESIHLPTWSEDSKCTICGQQYTAHEQMENDTSLWEY